MPKFRKGDEIRCINSDFDHLKVGSIHKVKDYTEDHMGNLCVLLDIGNEDLDGFYESRFELAYVTKFKKKLLRLLK